MSVPLMVGDALVAVLTLYTAAPDGFTADHGRLVQIVAPHLAKAIDAAVRTQSASRETVPPNNPARGTFGSSRDDTRKMRRGARLRPCRGASPLDRGAV